MYVFAQNCSQVSELLEIEIMSRSEKFKMGIVFFFFFFETACDAIRL